MSTEHSRFAIDHSAAFADGIRSLVSKAHERNRTAPIRHPDESGAFPGSWIDLAMQNESLLIVPDANVLLKDISRSCRDNERKILITAANSGAVRLICAQEVLDEVLDHSAEFAALHGIPYDVYINRWTKEYLPHMRVIPDATSLGRVLTREEAERVRPEVLRKDVPSATLALALGAFFMTEDRRAWRAVYGPDADDKERLDWLRALMAGSDAGEHAKTLTYVVGVPAFLLQEVIDFVKWLYKDHPTILSCGIGAIAVFALTIHPNKYRDIGSGLWNICSMLAGVFTPYGEALRRFKALTPIVPQWEELRLVNDDRSVLKRACIRELARSPRSLLSADELAQVIPALGVGQGVKLVRKTLRESSCFFQPYRGLWQVGSPSSNRPSRLDARV